MNRHFHRKFLRRNKKAVPSYNGTAFNPVESGWRDLNPRPFDPQSNALARLRYTPSQGAVRRTSAGTLWSSLAFSSIPGLGVFLPRFRPPTGPLLLCPAQAARLGSKSRSLPPPFLIAGDATRRVAVALSGSEACGGEEPGWSRRDELITLRAVVVSTQGWDQHRLELDTDLLAKADQTTPVLGILDPGMNRPWNDVRQLSPGNWALVVQW